MTLIRLLEIDIKLLPDESQLSVEIAERVWAEHGRPTKGPDLIEALEGAIQACGRDSVRYPPILLKRKKELERGEWSPAELAEGPCLVCDGLGYFLTSRSYVTCRCQSGAVIRGSAHA